MGGFHSSWLTSVSLPQRFECPQGFVPFGRGAQQGEQATLDLTVVQRLP
jgi:hypothetical protein